MKIQNDLVPLVLAIAGCSAVVLHNPNMDCHSAVKTLTQSIYITEIATPLSTLHAGLSEPITNTRATTTFVPVAPSTGYMTIVNKWRTKISMPELAHDPRLESNAMNTVLSSEGAMTHKLNAGTMAQVLAPGNATNFEQVFVGGWLCEVDSLPGLDGVCSKLSEGWAYNGQTGHAEILTSRDYSRIGCAFWTKIWSCDLA
jgi:uncharacterized protein YkwD